MQIKNNPRLHRILCGAFITLFLLAAALICIHSASAAVPVVTRSVTDFANILTPAEEYNLEQQILSIRNSTTVEIAIVTVPNTEYQDKVTYASLIGDKSGVGKKETDNGIVILWSLNNVQGGAIATGRGIESIITDYKAAQIGRGSRPIFDRGEYYNGFAYILRSLAVELNQDKAQGGSPQTSSQPPNQLPDINIIGVVAVIALVIIVAAAVRIFERNNEKKRIEQQRKYNDSTWKSSTPDHFHANNEADAALIAPAVIAGAAMSTVPDRKRRRSDDDIDHRYEDDENTSRTSSHSSHHQHDDDDSSSSSSSHDSGGGFSSGGFGGGGANF